MADSSHRILDAAESLFAPQGFDGASTRAIAQDASVNIGLLAYYFGSKKGVFIAVCERRLTTLATDLARIAGSDESPQGQLHAIIEAACSFLAGDGNGVFRMVVREMSLEQRPELRSTLVHMIQPLRRVFEEVLIGCGRQGVLRGVPVEAAAAALLGPVAMLVLMPETGRPGEVVRLVADQCLAAVEPDLEGQLELFESPANVVSAPPRLQGAGSRIEAAVLLDEFGIGLVD